MWMSVHVYSTAVAAVQMRRLSAGVAAGTLTANGRNLPRTIKLFLNGKLCKSKSLMIFGVIFCISGDGAKRIFVTAQKVDELKVHLD